MIILLIVGIFFRLWFIGLVPQPFGWDQYEYHQYARKILEHGWLASHSYRSYPYGLFVAALYAIFGFENFRAVWIAQAVLDSLTGLLVYATIRMISNDRRVAWLGFLLYLLNPFTSGYVGVMLSEVLASFTVIATVAAGAWFVRRPSWRSGVLLGIAAGLAAETRSSAFLWAAIPVGLALFSFARHALAKLGIVFGMVLTVLYPLFVNWRDYKEVNVATVDSIFARELFNGAILSRLPPFTYVYPEEVQRMYGEYYSEYDPARTKEERQAMAKKYIDKALAIINKDPKAYLFNRIEKMWYVWQKENIFFYAEPNFGNHRLITYWGNAALLLLAAIGLFVWKKGERFVRWSIIGTMVYASLAFSLTHAEYRLTIPFYPLLILSVTIAIDKSCRFAKHVLLKNTKFL